MANNSIGCSTKKTTLLDPNKFAGLNTNKFGNFIDSSSNIPVQLEDLTIYVELNTSKKARTILTLSDSTNTVSSTGGDNGSSEVTVNFIDGSDIGTKKFLTTNYTNLTTDFSSNDTKENLGITSIDIDFNSSIAPMITIQFVDVRGSAVFQHEEKERNNNKYSVFFQMPYPLFKLTIKGYYGMPVEYCLHMTKFTSRFNANTGNFEITCNFIGYTYAMLSDLLIGYLKAIPYTTLGKAYYNQTNVLKLDNLILKVAELNAELPKLLSTDESNSVKVEAERKLDIINSLISNYEKFSDEMTIRFKGSSSYKSNNYNYCIINKTDDGHPTVVDKYKKLITDEIENYNKTGEETTNEFRLDSKIMADFYDTNYFYDGLTISDLTTNATYITKLENDDNLRLDIINFIDGIYTPGYTIGNTVKFNIIDNKERLNKLKNIKSLLEKKIKSLKKEVANKLGEELKNKIGFNPVVRNIVEIFTKSADIFMKVIYDVSKEADSNPPERQNELLSKFNNIENYDINKSPYNNNNIKFYPWPEYREEEPEEGYVEKYLGSSGVLANPLNVTELRFIEDLFTAFITQAAKSLENDIIADEFTQNWGSINVLDSRLFNDEFPYRRIDPLSANDLAAYVLLRAMIFLGVSNRNLSQDEIIAMANSEAFGIMNDTQNKLTVLNAFSKLNIETLRAATLKVNGIDTRVIDENYNYNLIFNNTEDKYLPITKKAIDSINTFPTSTEGLINLRNDGGYFLSNYTFSNSGEKMDDGGVYVKILLDNSNESYTFNPASNYTTNLNNTESILQFEELKTDISNKRLSDIGFNIFGSGFGIQDFGTTNYGTNIGDGGDATWGTNYLFFANSVYSSSKETFGFFNGYKVDNNNFNKYEEFINYSVTDTTYKRINTDDYTSVNNEVYFENVGKNRQLLYKNSQENINIYYPSINFYDIGPDYVIPISLFGSKFYNFQTDEKVKAFLFLHTLPFNGLISVEEGRDFGGSLKQLFSPNVVYNLFAYRSGFIHVPKVWAAFIGGLYWRLKQNSDPIIWEMSLNNTSSSLIPDYIRQSNVNNNNTYPSQSQFLKVHNENLPMSFTYNGTYTSIDECLLEAPDQVANEFIRIFEDFVLNEWPTVKEKLEFNPKGINWINNLNNLYNAPTNADSYKWRNTVDIKQQLDFPNNEYSIVDNYNYFQFLHEVTGNFPAELRGNSIYYRHNLLLGISPTSDVNNTLISLFNKKVIIANANYKIWNDPNRGSTQLQGPARSSVNVKDADLNLYLSTIINSFSGKTDFNPEQRRKDLELQLFGTTDESLIKLRLYKTCKNIYDKWIGGMKGNDVFFQCGPRFPTDVDVAKNRGSNTPELIDSFRFVSRSFEDIGDDLAVNPVPLNDFMRNDPNLSFYEVVSSLLISNNFEFIALPTFINYRDQNVLAEVFNPQPVYDKTLPSCGPSFVCMYLGQLSKQLDFNDKNYSNDGFDVRCDEFGNLIDIPADFSSENYVEPVTFFSVNFGQQNQNIFKNITLDQSEFSETEESLQVVDDISKKGIETFRTLGGQNMYNIHSARSYKAEVEMLGNAMIQPMMYFQLNNIPMFHGAYLITRVKHSIVPNHMSTQFTGVRIRKQKTKLFDIGDMYMSLLDTLDNLNISTAPTAFRGGTNGAYSLGKSCGNYVVKLKQEQGTFVTTDRIAIALKPIRDLVGDVESNGDYNEWNNGYAGKKGPKTYNPSTMTISEIQTAQALSDTNVLGAVGKYQFIQGTFNSMVKALKLSGDTLFSPDIQEKAGLWLIKDGAGGYRKGLLNWFKDGSTGSESDLKKAITDLAREFASFPTYYNSTTSYSFDLGYLSNTALYGGSANNPTESKFCALDVAKALIESWEKLNVGKKPEITYDDLKKKAYEGSTVGTQVSNIDCTTGSEKITIDNSRNTVIMGDSYVGVLLKAGLDKTSKLGVFYNCVGKNIDWLINNLKTTLTKYPSVKNVIVSIGTNDGYPVNETTVNKIKELNNLIKDRFPKIEKYVITQGTIGWGNVKDIQPNQRTSYYNQFIDNGWILAKSDNIGKFDDSTKAHNSKDEYFKQIVVNINNNLN